MASELLLVNPRHRRRRRKMSAAQRQYFSKNPRRRHHRRRHSFFSGNPRRRAMSRRRSVSYNFKSNPAPLSLKQITNDFGPAVIGAGGALIVDWIFGTVPLPPSLTTGIMLPITRIGMAIGVGMLAGAVAGRATGEKVAVGALVVTSYSIIKGFLVTNVPGITLAGVGRFTPGNPGRLRGLGYNGPARISAMGPATGTQMGSGRVSPTMGRFVTSGR